MRKDRAQQKKEKVIQLDLFKDLTKPATIMKAAPAMMARQELNCYRNWRNGDPNRKFDGGSG